MTDTPELPKLFPKAQITTKKKKKLYKKKEYTQEETLRNFNKNYNKAFAFDEKIIDLTDVPPSWCQFITSDLSYIKFEHCTKLLMSFPFKCIRDLMPKMPKLNYLGLILCGISRLYLRWHSFQTIETLELTGNDIHKAESVLGVRHLPNLKTLILTSNPICYDKEEREHLVNELSNINIIF